MQAPRFWRNPADRPGLAARLLTPAAWLWAAKTVARVARPPKVVPGVPVICVGNLTAGGTGKTPTVMALLQRLSERTPHALSRGYGGRLEGPVQVDETKHRAEDTGDEPLLLSTFAPTWIARDRAAGAQAAEAAGAGVIVMDDGFQNPDVAKTLSLLVIDADAGFGNQRVIPAGPLREPVAAGLARADLLVTIGSDAAQDRLSEAVPALAPHPRLRARLAPLAMGMPWSSLRVIAFAGIGRPEKFFATLRAEGADVVATHSFPDHAPYSEMMLNRLQREASAAGAQLVTTEKDAARLPPEIRRQILTLPVRLEAEDWSPLETLLDAL